MPYKILWQKNVFHKTPNPVLLLIRDRFWSHLVMGIYARKSCTYWVSMIKPRTYQECTRKKVYCKLLVLISMLFVHPFIHTR